MKLAGGIMLSIIGLVALLIIVFSLSARLRLPGVPMAFLVQSGSMEPTIKVGDLVLVSSKDSYGKNDIVTFYDAHHRVVTHRIITLSQKPTLSYQTQGDANETPDTDTVLNPQIIGQVIFTLPKIGHLVSFAHSPGGMMLLVIIPAVIIVIDEIIKLISHLSVPTKN